MMIRWPPAIGSVALLLPRRVPQIFGADAPTADARTEVRAVYGGIPFAMAAVITMGRPDGLSAAAAASGGMAIAQAGGMLVEPRSRTATTATFLLLEAGLALLLGRASRHSRVTRADCGRLRPIDSPTG